jgi:hypothetical protein
MEAMAEVPPIILPGTGRHFLGNGTAIVMGRIVLRFQEKEVHRQVLR